MLRAIGSSAAAFLLTGCLALAAPALARDPKLKVTPRHPGPTTPIRVTFTTPTGLPTGWAWSISIDSCKDESVVRLIRKPRNAGVRFTVTLRPTQLPSHQRWCRGLSPVRVAKTGSGVTRPVARTTVRIG